MRYPSILEEDAFMQLLAEGGYMVGKLAQILYPGHLISRLSDAVEKTRRLIDENENVCIHEATIVSDRKMIRVDILRKKGKTLELIEVKAKSWNSTVDDLSEPKTAREFEEYLEDVAFQYIVLSEAFPEYTIKPYLFMPDKSKRTNIEGLNGQFELIALPETAGGFKGFDVKFHGSEKEIRRDDLMTKVDVLPFVQKIEWTMQLAIIECLDMLFPKLTKHQAEISIECGKCEYRLQQGAARNGFAECWGARAFQPSHILNLTQLGNINRMTGNSINKAIKQGRVSISDLNADTFKGKYNNRPFYQATAKNELIERELWDELDFKYPLCFIDFECSRMALPYHRGMRPYENVAFQWSCHTVHKPGEAPVHSDWINTDDTFPNFKFAVSLMKQIKNAGTVLIWTTYENTILKEIYEQMKAYGYENDELKSWLECFVKFGKGDSCGYTDLAAIACKYYHHPLCQGKYSIKYVLPAVLHEAKSNSIIQWLDQLKLFDINEEGKIVNPYDLLPQLDVGSKTVVKDGTGAMRAYQDMQYGIHKNKPLIKMQWKEALRQYCRLDTLAMVIIWEYWREKQVAGKVVRMRF
ncbi:MAG TPA: DUF2779 domain-containing protein [Flavitalea sp.]|nr:DUF2779 domain-containing protein [Flavitalea sp.]